ncbi:hypothetical protein CRUP_006081, partial [Coryphaenoides rupestris]
MDFQVFGVVLVVLACVEQSLCASCVVESFTVKEDFDPKRADGSCDDGYSLVFSRNPRGFPPAVQRTVRQKQEELCMVGQFQPVLQS